MQMLAIYIIFFGILTINFGRLDLHMDAKIHKKFISEFHAAVSPKLDIENAPTFGVRLSHEFAFFLHKFHECVTLKSTFD